MQNDPVNFVDPSGLDHEAPPDHPEHIDRIVTNTWAPYWPWGGFGGGGGGMFMVELGSEVDPHGGDPGGGDPQNPTPVPLPSRNAIKQRVGNGDCNAYIAALLAKATELFGKQGNVAVAKDGLDLLSMINNFVLKDFLRVEGYGAAGTVGGSILGNNTDPAGSATIIISTKFLFPSDPQSRTAYWQEEYIDTAIHEMLHLSGRYTGFDDRQLAVAASRLPGASSKLPAAPKGPRDALGYQYNSGYYDAELKRHCGGGRR